jgi:hypothetical protein
LLPFQPLGQYKWPSLPAEESARLLWRRWARLFRKKPVKHAIGEDRLQRTLAKVLNEVVSPPACGPLSRELSLSLEGWAAEREPAQRTKLIVLPPGDAQGIVDLWAGEGGHQVLAAPARESLVSPVRAAALDLRGEGLLVVPQLERWFLRQRHGLETVRRLLAEIDAQKRPCLIGCNGWAWRFLVRAVSADTILPEPLTFQPFDAGRLQRWFAELSTVPEAARIRFRLPQNGADVMALKEGGIPESDYFTKLAAQSLGIPWVAWHLWRRSLRSVRQEEGSEAGPGDNFRDDEETLWVTAPEDFSLPERHRTTGLLVLQALLIHGSLTAEELRLVLPIVGESFIVAGLIGAGFVELEGKALRCRPIAYPAARSELFAAGFPMGEI